MNNSRGSSQPAAAAGLPLSLLYCVNLPISDGQQSPEREREKEKSPTVEKLLLSLVSEPEPEQERGSRSTRETGPFQPARPFGSFSFLASRRTEIYVYLSQQGKQGSCMHACMHVCLSRAATPAFPRDGRAVFCRAEQKTMFSMYKYSGEGRGRGSSRQAQAMRNPWSGRGRGVSERCGV